MGAGSAVVASVMVPVLTRRLCPRCSRTRSGTDRGGVRGHAVRDDQVSAGSTGVALDSGLGRPGRRRGVILDCAPGWE